MNRTLYSILVTLLTPLLVVYLLLRSRKDPSYRLRWGERFGVTRLLPSQVLIHSVSMGETLAAVPLIRQLLSAYPGYRLTLTTSSPAGSAQVLKAFAAEIQQGRVQHVYLPFDIPLAIHRFIKQLAPKLVIIMETELWPNLIHYSHQAGAKVVLANGRLSEKSAQKYHKQITLVAPMLKQLAAIAVQTPAEAERFIELGVKDERISVCGSLKFDLNIDAKRQAASAELRRHWQKDKAPVWVAGSVHPGEFAAMIEAHQLVLAQYPAALMILVPRHPEQFALAAQTLAAAGFKVARRSQQTDITAHTQVLLGDTMGELLDLYGCGDQAFVGGSLIVHGGHNPLEPAALGLAVYMGPNYRDFLEIGQLLQDAHNLTVVSSGEALGQALLAKIANPALRQQAGDAGLSVLAQNRGALDKQLALIKQLSA
ncbi:3-deoxy-D-manno-octulosonic acid transferase [Shewanella sp. SNU WT4]|uniref:lipid IV(A) 3-deoxy-D-manno-octulosonic acid transferase n=1 Tax=Shewanella sp. SNU WT4 TaxID=2590015 RepID=UPI00112BECFF|nr:lipid IV(A) 3-deoxy-D-manno-octulosonic acid transferase [Shewanella sp. SNU WT4]QDF65623.1 3-deoxy-D-manno-octulosonic acid transferase [Shewanella sp. SNU WT4]